MSKALKELEWEKSKKVFSSFHPEFECLMLTKLLGSDLPFRLLIEFKSQDIHRQSPIFLICSAEQNLLKLKTKNM